MDISETLKKIGALYATRKTEIVLKQNEIQQAEQVQTQEKKDVQNIAKSDQQGDDQTQAKNVQKLPLQKRKRLFHEKIVPKSKLKKAGALRQAAGDIWQDLTMLDWPQNDYRIFCGNLGNEVSDEVLASSFRRYPSFQMARVIRDKKSCKTKGFGFVSFHDPNDYLRAFRELNGKYVGNRPVKLMKSQWKERCYDNKKIQEDDLNYEYKKDSKKRAKKI